MNLYHVSIAHLFLCFLLRIFAAGGSDPTHLAEDISINCGSTDTSAAVHGGEWVGDVRPKSSSLVQVKGSSSTSAVIHKKVIPADLTVPHKTARISRSQFSYEFQLNPGQKILRLHFNPAPYKGFEGLKDLFTVEAGPFTLLGNFSASLTARALVVNSFVKEFCFYLHEDERLDLNFSPASSSPSLHTYAFVNGIEIISVPSGLSYFHGGDVGAQVVGQKSQVYYVDYETALEMIHRQDIMHNNGPSTGDFGHLFPTWVTQKAKRMKNNTWRIPVDVGFRYLIRLHFSEVGLGIAGSDDLRFEVFINDIIAHTNIYAGKGSDGTTIPWNTDYMVMIRGRKKEIRRDLVISLHSYAEVIDRVGVLAGFEIFKLSNPDNSLAGPNPLPPAKDTPPHSIQTILSAIGQKYVTVLIVVLLLVNVIVQKLSEFRESTTKEENKLSDRAQRLCRRFSLAEIKLATRNFSDGLLIGRGGFGKVYKGIIDKGETIVAIKRLKADSTQGSPQFLAEIETLSELRHINLVSLVGYCKGHGEMILVYDYMAGGTLADHLYKLPRKNNNNSSLTWKQRLNICIGAARGFDYLHTGHGVIHRDVKTSNILLDENFTAKVSDFGLVKHENRTKLDSPVTTEVKGTRGYLDPHYINSRKLTRKSDTYAFGVVLLEILCERPAVDRWVVEEERILTEWARENISMGKLDQIVSSSLRGVVSEVSLRKFVEVVEKCLHDEPKERPTMAEVVIQLESALELQDQEQVRESNEITHVSDDKRDDHSSNTTKPTMPSTDLQRPPLEEKSKFEVSRKGDARKAKTRRLGPWGAIWKRIKPFRRSELPEIDEEISEANIRVPKFDWHTIAAATGHFSPSNVVGRHIFGYVYKAILLAGQVVAVKSFSLNTGQGLEEFKNQILLHPRLQHRNINKILGYCIHGEEKLIVYQFIENKSLNIFMAEKGRHLQWSIRFKIILGIARGLVYLHQDSAPRVIHRNISSNVILLDVEMNPSISNFAFARTLGEGEHQSELETSRIVGTMGYMCPEYFRDGKFSVKTDVYSFGIIVLEIVSGRRILHPINQATELVTQAWKLWRAGKALDLVDESLGGVFPVEEALRSIHVALLCIQEHPHDRPTMPSVLKMLVGAEVLVEPQEPWPLSFDTNATYESDVTLKR